MPITTLRRRAEKACYPPVLSSALPRLVKSNTKSLIAEGYKNYKSRGSPPSASPRLPRPPTLQHALQVADIHRLADVIVHARGQAVLAVALHGVGGHCHDR